MLLNRWLLLGCCAVAAGVASFMVYDGQIAVGRKSNSADRVTTSTREANVPVAKVDQAGPTTTPGANGTKHDSGDDTLSAEDRKYIWDIEHIALVLDVHAFPRIGKA